MHDLVEPYLFLSRKYMHTSAYLFTHIQNWVENRNTLRHLRACMYAYLEKLLASLFDNVDIFGHNIFIFVRLRVFQGIPFQMSSFSRYD